MLQLLPARIASRGRISDSEPKRNALATRRLRVERDAEPLTRIKALALRLASCGPVQATQEYDMAASEIARRHFAAALKEADAIGVDHDGLCRSLLGLIVSEYLTTRDVADVQSELRFVADNCDPDADFMFMRP